MLARNRVWGHARFWRRDGCDRLRIHESREEAGRFIWGKPYQDRVQFTRFWHNTDGRIECICQYFRENDTHYRQFEWFTYKGKRCVESIQQSFAIMPEIPYFPRESSEKKLRKDYRPLEGDELIQNLVETMFWRQRVKYSYSPSGDLVKAEMFNADGKPEEGLLFQKLSERPFEETIEELATRTASPILKAATKRAQASGHDSACQARTTSQQSKSSTEVACRITKTDRSLRQVVVGNLCYMDKMECLQIDSCISPRFFVVFAWIQVVQRRPTRPESRAL